MSALYFATHNQNKIKEAEAILGMKVKPLSFEIDEIQSLDQIEVAVKKAEAYFAKVKKPLFVEDISFTIDYLKGLPGTYIDAFLNTLGNQGITDIMKHTNKRNAQVQATIVYKDAVNATEVFTSKIKGIISKIPKGQGFGWDPIFIPSGENKTFGEMSLDEKNKFSMRAKALKKLEKWLSSSKLRK